MDKNEYIDLFHKLQLNEVAFKPLFRCDDEVLALVNAALAQRTWVGLTDDEINKYFLDNWARYYSYHGCFRELMRWQEERLKEKNT